jgi:hypothetical protein
MKYVGTLTFKGPFKILGTIEPMAQILYLK